MVVAYFSESDIDAIASAGASLLYLTFFGICLGVFATLGAIFLGSDVTEPKKLAICIALIFTSGIGTVVFGFLGRSEYKNSRATAARFKEKFSQTKKEGHS
jgi:choline-glycine betaine transporter